MENDSVSQTRGGVWVCLVIGIVAIGYGLVTLSFGTVGIGIAVVVGMALLLRFT